METLETTCNRPDFCDHHYFLSKALLGNPHCWPAGAITTLAVVIYIFAVILAMLVWSMHKVRHANKAVPMEQLPMITTRHNRSNSPNAFVPAPLPCLTAICMRMHVNADTCGTQRTSFAMNKTSAPISTMRNSYLIALPPKFAYKSTT
ncbi:hypothetical protein RB195_023038 [Necator americanus]